MSAPFYWMYETSEVLRPAIEAQIAAMRAYLRQWIAAPWKGPGIDALRQRIDDLTSREAIESWLETHHRSAVKEGEL